MDLNLKLVETGVVSAEQYLKALVAQRRDRPPIGQIAMELGHLTPVQVREVLHVQRLNQDRRFGEIAISLGYLSRMELAELLMEQSSRERAIEELLVETGEVSAEMLVEQELVGTSA